MTNCCEETTKIQDILMAATSQKQAASRMYMGFNSDTGCDGEGFRSLEEAVSIYAYCKCPTKAEVLEELLKGFEFRVRYLESLESLIADNDEKQYDIEDVAAIELRWAAENGSMKRLEALVQRFAALLEEQRTLEATLDRMTGQQ